MAINLDTSTHMEALKLVREWSSGLVLVQSGALAVMGALLKQRPEGWHLLITILLIITLVFSIWVGAVWVSGTIPSIAQRLPHLLANNPGLDIYSESGGLLRRRLFYSNSRLGDECQLQSVSFMLSLLLFALFILFLPPVPSSS